MHVLRHRFFVIVRRVLVVALGLMLLGIALIKLAPTTAANITDTVLRPIFGPTAVVTVEKFFFNAQDRLQQVTAQHRAEQSPLLVGHDSSVTQGGALQLEPLKPLSTLTPVAGEGTWLNHPLALFPNQTVAAYTFIRPDPDRPYAFVTVVQLDMQRLQLHAVAGTKQPGGPVQHVGPGVIPADIQASGRVVAAFDGGFQYRDGQYGMIVGSQTYLPLQPNLATLVGYTDGQLRLVEYINQSLGSGIDFVRQNCPILVQAGRNAVLDEVNKKLWGRTLSTGMYTWRSGLGLTKSGNLLFAVGNNLTPKTLAQALIMAGADSAMQLDINPGWVRFNFFSPDGHGSYTSTTLTKGLHDGAQQYLHGYTKDFFYITAR